MLGQPPLKIAKNQQTLVMSTNSVLSSKLKEKFVSNLQVDSDKSKGQPRDMEMNQKHIDAGFQFIVT